MHQKCGERIWRYCPRLSGGEDDRSVILEVASSFFTVFVVLMQECSLKYHRLHPEYIHQRIERLGHAYSLRILLLMCDVVSDMTSLPIGL